VLHDVPHWIGVARQIQSLGQATYLTIKPEQLEIVLTSLDPRGLFISTYASSREQADQLVERAAALTSKRG
jgi:hypothetical protein